MADRVGQQFGNYRLVALLGQGGFAEVYLGQHVRLSLQAAIKVLHTHLTGSEESEAIIQSNLSAIGIKLDIHNYLSSTFFGSFLPAGKASPPTGAVAGRYDIAEFETSFGYDPDDSSLLSCDQMPPNGGNFDFYCNRALDALYQQELATLDPGVRQGIFDQIHLIYTHQFPFIVLYGVPDIAMVRKGTHNYQISSLNGETINIWEWWCDKGKC